MTGGGGKKTKRRLEQLPLEILESIMTWLDVASICSLACTCKTLESCASNVLTFLDKFHFPDHIAPTIELLERLLPLNPNLRSLKVDCEELDCSNVDLIIKPSLQEICLRNCFRFDGMLLYKIGNQCKDLRSLYVASVADRRGMKILVTDLEEILNNCTQLELSTKIWAPASDKLTSLEIGSIDSWAVVETLNSNVGQEGSSSNVSCIKKLRLSVDLISDALIAAISNALISLTDLDLRDAPYSQPIIDYDLANSGLQQIDQIDYDLTNAGLRTLNCNGELRRLSIVRIPKYRNSSFMGVNDAGLIFLAEKCKKLESICLGGFTHITDVGFERLFCSCPKLYKFRVFAGNSKFTGQAFRDLSTSSLSLTHVSLRKCSSLTNIAIVNLVEKSDLQILDLRRCERIGNTALRAIGSLSKLKVLLLDDTNITDKGLSFLRGRVISSLVSLSVRGCKQLTGKGISNLFEGLSKLELQRLDMSDIPELTDDGVLSFAKCHSPITVLRIGGSSLITDISIEALAHSDLQLLDLYHCGGITELASQWFEKPYFPKLKSLCFSGSIGADLAINRQKLYVGWCGCEQRSSALNLSGNLDSIDFSDFGTKDEEYLLF
ncbi:F-box/LRR-repeat protein 10-like isoform X2 [Tripterygium wilfordii]|uniref:F-box/LRR-repeat protein 10-like isoform X2 n=1 Tax=Tripterygium wilfordii TaxID=458696 RepID=UPI0018F7F6C8|nr:F-box/LRR-repeat protein 10-like isoform X2 [Tripterygium wilfordii]